MKNGTNKLFSLIPGLRFPSISKGLALLAAATTLGAGGYASYQSGYLANTAPVAFATSENLEYPQHFSQSSFASMIAKIKSLPGNEAMRDEFIHEIEEIQSTNNPQVPANLGYVWVASARSSYTQKPIDSSSVVDLKDDYNRMRLGIEVVKNAIAQNLGIPKEQLTQDQIIMHGPIIIYNGRPQHNIELRWALESGLLNDYPKEKFLILELHPDLMHTRGQLISIKEHLHLSNAVVGIVTHGYHFPRMRRMIGAHEPFDFFGANTKIFTFLVDRQFRAPGIEGDLLAEPQKLPIYIAKGDLMAEPNQNIIFTDRADNSSSLSR